MEFSAEGSGLRVQAWGVGAQGFGLRVDGFKVAGCGLRVHWLEFSMQGAQVVGGTLTVSRIAAIRNCASVRVPS